MKRIRGLIDKYAMSATMVLVALCLAATAYAVAQVENERESSILRACEAQNLRHDATHQEIDSLYAKFEAKVSGAKLVQLQTSKQFTLLIIDRLAPHQDCSAVVSKSTSN